MKEEVGDFIRNAVQRQTKKSITQLGKEIGISRITVNAILKKDEMELKYILAFEKALGIPILSELKKKPKSYSQILKEHEDRDEDFNKIKEKYEALKAEHEDLKNRYIEMMEKYINSKKR